MKDQRCFTHFSCVRITHTRRECARSLTNTHTNFPPHTLLSCLTEWSINQIPTASQRGGVGTKQARDKKERAEEKDEEGGGGGGRGEWPWGIVRPCESSPQKQKELWVCAHSEERLAGTHPTLHTTITTTSLIPPPPHPAEKSFGCSLVARGTALDTYHVHQVLSVGFLFSKT